MSLDVEKWSTQAKKGILELAVLTALSGDRLYGYALVERLKTVPGLVVSEGTIYPIMSRLSREGMVEATLEASPDGPARKYYSLSTTGRSTLAAMQARWQMMVRGLEQLGHTDAD